MDTTWGHTDPNASRTKACKALSCPGENASVTFWIGRNVDEAIRVLDAWIHNETHGEVCPANWEKGKDAMSATNDGVAAYLASH